MPESIRTQKPVLVPNGGWGDYPHLVPPPPADDTYTQPPRPSVPTDTDYMQDYMLLNTGPNGTMEYVPIPRNGILAPSCSQQSIQGTPSPSLQAWNPMAGTATMDNFQHTTANRASNVATGPITNGFAPNHPSQGNTIPRSMPNPNYPDEANGIPGPSSHRASTRNAQGIANSPADSLESITPEIPAATVPMTTGPGQRKRKRQVHQAMPPAKRNSKSQNTAGPIDPQQTGVQNSMGQLSPGLGNSAPVTSPQLSVQPSGAPTQQAQGPPSNGFSSQPAQGLQPQQAVSHPPNHSGIDGRPQAREMPRTPSPQILRDKDIKTGSMYPTDSSDESVSHLVQPTTPENPFVGDADVMAHEDKELTRLMDFVQNEMLGGWTGGTYDIPPFPQKPAYRPSQEVIDAGLLAAEKSLKTRPILGVSQTQQCQHPPQHQSQHQTQNGLMNQGYEQLSGAVNRNALLPNNSGPSGAMGSAQSQQHGDLAASSVTGFNNSTNNGPPPATAQEEEATTNIGTNESFHSSPPLQQLPKIKQESPDPEEEALGQRLLKEIYEEKAKQVFVNDNSWMVGVFGPDGLPSAEWPPP